MNNQITFYAPVSRFHPLQEAQDDDLWDNIIVDAVDGNLWRAASLKQERRLALGLIICELEDHFQITVHFVHIT
jgi:hypothetical protein